tara:strand:+ start:132 stop:1079 length:948 start_codon:yes stop_codon:yes gene_type:complete
LKYRIAILERIDQQSFKKNLSSVEIIDLTEHTEDDQFKTLNLFDVVVVKSRTQVNKKFIDSASKLKIIARAGIGTENIDSDYAFNKGIKVISTPTANSISTAEFTISLILTMVRNIPETISMINKGDYRRHLIEGREISKLKVGIIGLGKVGSLVAEKLVGLGSNVIGYDINPDARKNSAFIGIEISNDIAYVLSSVDIISFHVPLTTENIGILNSKSLKLMKEGSIVINTSRGDVINENDLLSALNSGKIKKAALDVICNEPVFEFRENKQHLTSSIIHHPKVFYTPHMAASTTDAQERIAIELGQKISNILTA